MARIVFTLEDGTEIETELDADLVTIGRHPESMVVLPSSSVSSHHATIKCRAGDYFVQDLGTTNGTKLNGAEVEEAKLADGDQVMFGDIPAVLFLSDGAPLKAAALAAVDLPPPNFGTPNVPPARSQSWNRPNLRPTAQYKQSSGCAGFLMFFIFLVLAFTVGLCLRHYNETQGFLPVDMLSKMRGKSEADAAPDKGADDKKAPAKAKPTEPAANPAAPADAKLKDEPKPAAPEMNMNGEPKMNQ